MLIHYSLKIHSPSLSGFNLNLTFNWCNEQVTFYQKKKMPNHVTVSDES